MPSTTFHLQDRYKGFKMKVIRKVEQAIEKLVSDKVFMLVAGVYIGMQVAKLILG